MQPPLHAFRNFTAIHEHELLKKRQKLRRHFAKFWEKNSLITFPVSSTKDSLSIKKCQQQCLRTLNRIQVTKTHSLGNLCQRRSGHGYIAAIIQLHAQME
jgi:hypothetical protein